MWVALNTTLIVIPLREYCVHVCERVCAYVYVCVYIHTCICVVICSFPHTCKWQSKVAQSSLQTFSEMQYLQCLNKGGEGREEKGERRGDGRRGSRGEGRGEEGRGGEEGEGKEGGGETGDRREGKQQYSRELLNACHRYRSCGLPCSGCLGVHMCTVTA